MILNIVTFSIRTFNHDTRHKDIQHCDIQQKDTQGNDNQHNGTQVNDTRHSVTRYENTQYIVFRPLFYFMPFRNKLVHFTLTYISTQASILDGLLDKAWSKYKKQT
jgi:hypothetical protein